MTVSVSLGVLDSLVQRFAPAGNRFVVTSRIAGYRDLPLGGEFSTFRVRPMDEQQIREFLERWCRAVEDATSDLPAEQREANAQREIESISAAIEASPGVERLATNPLLLTILALIHRTGAALPQRRIELYELAVLPLCQAGRRRRPLMDY
jgi:predicted NACHT family NTPase